MKNMKLGKTAGTALLLGALLVSLFACKKQEGPAERAGKSLDNATEKVGQKIERAGNNIQDAARGNKK